MIDRLLFSFCALQEMVLKEFEEKLEGVVNFEVAPDNIGQNVNRGFGFCTFKDQDACKAAHSKHESTKLEILVSARARFAVLCMR